MTKNYHGSNEFTTSGHTGFHVEIPCKIVPFSRIFLKMQGYLWIIWVKLAGALWIIGGKLGSSLIFYFVAIHYPRPILVWGTECPNE
jgi:hypothetical protein